MPSQQVHFQQFFAAPPAQVFAYFADHEKFGRIWPGQFRRIKDGQDPAEPNGLGSVREIKAIGPPFEETIVVFEPPKRIEYVVSRGSPIKNHRGVILFKEASGDTQLDYSISFDPRIPFTGGLIARVLENGWRRGVQRALADIGSG
ncbi:MAG: SRPBCC family protein [Nevskiales bacterium]